MAYGLFKKFETNSNNGGKRYLVAANSLAVVQGTPLKATATGAAIAAAGDSIVGISTQKKTFASDNFTVAKEKVQFDPEVNMNNTYLLPINGGTITLADEGVSYYDIAVSGATYAADGTTESSSTGTLLLVKYISSTLGVFRIVNM